ncbi:hypothetical protein EFN64_08285 [Leuconostoc citreum]|nr:hypothetical protein [Leuconostoc citreum]MCT3062950.1 hypothetical protein [Leuconostoc citreum]MCT3073734.1 hypothetical protein [Leuconostoc citreum]HCM89204.1 hypothetical protein [Vagococcus sp.]
MEKIIKMINLNSNNIEGWHHLLEQQLEKYISGFRDFSKNKSQLPVINLIFDPSKKIILFTKFVTDNCFEIVISDGLIEKFNYLHEEILLKLEPNITDPNLINKKNIVYKDENSKIHFEEIMLMSLCFVLYHELGHILNGHLNYSISVENTVSVKNQRVMEMDADAFATTQLVSLTQTSNDKFSVYQAILLGSIMPIVLTFITDKREEQYNKISSGKSVHYDTQTRILHVYLVIKSYNQQVLNNIVDDFNFFTPLIDIIITEFLEAQTTPISNNLLFDQVDIDDCKKTIQSDNEYWLNTLEPQLEGYAYILLYNEK